MRGKDEFGCTVEAGVLMNCDSHESITWIAWYIAIEIVVYNVKSSGTSMYNQVEMLCNVRHPEAPVKRPTSV
jgi:hypothetical protein